jgi:AcrR family transcriptional regulator
MPRKYDQRARAEAAEETRRRILDAMYRRLDESPAENLSVERVAELAGVARSTVYVIFGSRAGLFDAFVTDLYDRAGFERIVAAVQHPDARQHLREGLRAGCQTYASVRNVSRAVFSMGALDPDALAGATQRIEQSRLGGMEYLARRLAEQGVLRDDVTVKQATDVLWLAASFEAFDALYTGRGLGVRATADRLIAMAERTLCRPEE